MKRLSPVSHILSLALFVSGAVACDGATATGTQAQVTPLVAGTQAPASAFDHPAIAVPPKSRAVKRLTVAQLRNAIPIVAGKALGGPSGQPIQWRIDRDGTMVDALGPDGVASALGEPDYVQVTSEPAEPTPLYVKFADDMARDVCQRMAEADLSRPPATRSLRRFADVDANLRYLKLRFLGERLADNTSPPALRSLYDRVLQSDNEEAAWLAVCVAVLSSPSFHLY